MFWGSLAPHKVIAERKSAYSNFRSRHIDANSSFLSIHLINKIIRDDIIALFAYALLHHKKAPWDVV